MLQGKHILIGITGSIAAYKAAILIRLLVKQGAEVKVLMTPLSKQFISPLTIATLSKNPILVDFFNPENGQWNSHIDLSSWADLYLIAPATANTIAKMAHGIADNLLLTTYLSARCPTIIAPAMDLDMYQHSATKNNIQQLKLSGCMIIEPACGQLASGLEGKGRMEEPENIVQYIIQYFDKKQQLKNKTILITAGPTYEPLDPIRFIGNYSSGKMGYAIAEEVANRGAKVILVSGPVQLNILHPNVELIKVQTAEEMLKACLANFHLCDAAILAAAVADYRPEIKAQHKLKRITNTLQLNLIANPDIAETLGKQKKKNQILIGFALETENIIENAQKKLQNKNFDFIVLNQANNPETGFMVDTNQITIIDKHNKIEKFELKSKNAVAIDIVNKLQNYIS